MIKKQPSNNLILNSYSPFFPVFMNFMLFIELVHCYI